MIAINTTIKYLALLERLITFIKGLLSMEHNFMLLFLTYRKTHHYAELFYEFTLLKIFQKMKSSTYEMV